MSCYINRDECLSSGNERQNTMWTWSLNWNEITPNLVIGTCPMQSGDLIRIQMETRVSAVFSLQHDDCLAYWGIDYAQMQTKASELDLAIVRCPIRDFDIADMRRQLPAAISMLATLQTNGHRTYAHCTAGLGRSALVILAYLILIEDRDPEEAISLILSSRSDAVPAWEAYFGCKHDLVERNRNAIEQRAYELYELRANNNAEDDWEQAEKEVLRKELLKPICE